MTMVVDEGDFLKIWLDYWRRYLPDECLHVICHGENPELESLARGVRFENIARNAPYPEMENDRWKMLADKVSALTRDGFTVVYTDVDEILIADPRHTGSVVDKLMRVDVPVAHTLGLEVIHRTDKAPEPISLDMPILRQRQYFRTTSFYSKPCIVTAPVRWGRGGHFADAEKLYFIRGLYTVHLRFFEMNQFRERARARRAMTDAPENLKALHHRRWRESDEGIEDVIAELHAMKCPRIRSMFTLRLLWRIWRTRKKVPNEDGLYVYALCTGDLQRFPRRFLNLI
ncbi:hypothetical protein [Roseovarius sp. D22-M7]|uniref:hypothetical protein n=1 Tax=Roseovarius sp. D22-M7 TaxID=3127116 RepID=UPI00300FF2C5